MKPSVYVFLMSFEGRSKHVRITIFSAQIKEVCYAIFDRQKIRTLAFTADDLWMDVISELNSTEMCYTTKVAHTFSVVG